MNKRVVRWTVWPLGLVGLLVLALYLGGPSIQDRIYESGVQAARVAADLEPGTVETTGHGSLKYLYRSGDGPAVVLIHGFASEADVWLSMARHLPEHLRIHAPDLPGHGHNRPDLDADYHADSLVDTLLEALNDWGLETFHVVGTSMGGNLALRLALREPDRVTSLGLMAPAVFEAPDPSPVEKELAEGRNPLIVRDADGFEDMLETVFHKAPPMPWPSREVLVRRALERAPVRDRIWEALWDSRGELDDALGDIRQPSLLIWGREDRAVDISSLSLLEDALGSETIETVVLDETGHSPMLERPEETARILTRFLQSIKED